MLDTQTAWWRQSGSRKVCQYIQTVTSEIRLGNAAYWYWAPPVSVDLARDRSTEQIACKTPLRLLIFINIFSCTQWVANLCIRTYAVTDCIGELKNSCVYTARDRPTFWLSRAGVCDRMCIRRCSLSGLLSGLLETDWRPVCWHNAQNTSQQTGRTLRGSTMDSALSPFQFTASI